MSRPHQIASALSDAILALKLDRESPADVATALTLVAGFYFGQIPDPSDRTEVLVAATRLAATKASDTAGSLAH